MAEEEAKLTVEETATVTGAEETPTATTATAQAEAGAEEDAEQKTEAKEDEKEEDTPFYTRGFKSFYVIDHLTRGRRGKRSSAYVDRLKRMLRTFEEVHLYGINTGISQACEVVARLQREKIAVVAKVSTGVNVQPYFNEYSKVVLNEAYTSIDFVLTRGELATYISDSKLKRLLPIFEGLDKDRTGSVSRAELEALDMAKAFYSTEEQVSAANAILDTDGAEISMPTYIKYVSTLIHCNLRLGVFMQRCEEFYGIAAPKGRRRRGGGAK